MANFNFSLDDSEKKYLKDLVQQSIASRFAGEDPEVPEPPADKLKKELGAFVTLKIEGNLRGCIGAIVGREPVYLNVWHMAQAAAFNDPRFPKLTEEEFKKVDVEISILSPVVECTNPHGIKVGTHGLIIQRGDKSGLLLPQVPVEWGWGREKFLEQTCAKAGLSPNAWNKAGTTIYWFQAEVF